MDGERFDRLTKQLSTTRLTRLSVIRGLAVGAVAAVSGTAIGADRAMAAQCKKEGQICEGGPDKCCPGTVCNGGENPTKCRACGGSGQFCCTSTTPCTAPGEVCLPGGICGPAACGGTGQPCCEPGDTCNESGDICLSNGTCGPEGQCGGTGEPCCEPDDTCNESGDICLSNGTCGPEGQCGGDGQPCCQPGDICNEPGEVCLANGTCGTIGVACHTGETALACCIRGVKRACKRRGSNRNARHNCLKLGKNRCKKAFG